MVTGGLPLKYFKLAMLCFSMVIAQQVISNKIIAIENQDSLTNEPLMDFRPRRDLKSRVRIASRSTQSEFLQIPLTQNANPSKDSPLVGFCHPTDGQGFLSQGNNGRTHRGRTAYAYDLAMPIGTPVYAMRRGRVVGVRDKFPDTGGGRSKFSKFNFVMLRHDGGYRSVYMHLKQRSNAFVRLQEGDWVEAGQLIGYSGNSGFSLGPHLHIEVQQPSSGRSFKDTVPFIVSGLCQSEAIARE